MVKPPILAIQMEIKQVFVMCNVDIHYFVMVVLCFGMLLVVCLHE